MSTPTRNTPLDLVETSQKMVDAAVAVTTGRLHLSSPDDALLRLRANDHQAVTSFRTEMARQIASALLMMDPNVTEVFEDQDYSRQASLEINASLRFCIRARYQTAALHTVIDALDQALRQAYTLLTQQQPARVIEAIIVDDRDNRLLNVGSVRTGPAPVLLVQRR
jgi:hypothetical protein